VTVTRREVVGPYETVQLKSTDPQALTAWLGRNGYTIPKEIEPVIASYVNEKFDFLALKLVPGANVQSMRPVRVTTAGAGAALPLRMVAAGTGQTVGITLWIVAEGRYEPQNFPSFQIKPEDFAWDWAANASNYKEVRAQKTKESGGRAWEIETSLEISQEAISNALQYGFFNGGGGGLPAQPVVTTDYPAASQAESEKLRQDDLDTLFAGIPANRMRVTRMRADLSREALATDLAVTASRDQSLVQALRVPQKEIGQPLCTVWRDCTAGEQRPRDEAIALSQSGGKESFSCTTAREDATSMGLGAVGLAGFVGLAVARRRRHQP
jgi:MYXO-CTERM domain-containing protein